MKKLSIALYTLLMIQTVASGQSWTELGESSKVPLNANGSINALASDPSLNIYAAGNFTNSSSKYYVAKWNAVLWSEPGVGVKGGVALDANNGINAVTSDASGNIYAAGSFTNSTGAYYVAKFTPNAWSELGGSQAPLGANGNINALTSDASGNIYAAGSFTNSSGKYYVAEWNGKAWVELGDKAPLDANGNIYALISDASGNIYAAGDFKNTSSTYYVAKWDGKGWSELTGKAPLDANGSIYALASDASGNIFAAGAFTNKSGKYYVAKWDGKVWSEAGASSKGGALNANGIIKALASTSGNIYAAGAFTNASGSNYVAKFNDDKTGWTELGTKTSALNANGLINALTSDGSGNIYAAGAFTNKGGNYYVAKFDQALDSVVVKTQNNVPPTITTNGGTLQLVATVYPSTSSQNVTWSITPGTGTATINSSGLITPQSNGTVWVKAASVVNPAKTDSIQITISGQIIPVTSVVVKTLNNMLPNIKTNAGTLQMIVTVSPSIADQDVTWSIIPGTGTATINSSGLVTAQTNGTVWAKAASLAYPDKSDSVQITITGQIVPVDSVVVKTQNNVPAAVTTNGGTLQIEATVFPATANQDVAWSLIPGTGTATINSTGLVTAQTNGSVWVKAISVTDATKADSLEITITGQVVAIDSVVVKTQNNVPATINTKNGTLQMEATVYPATASQDVIWSITPGTGTATINSTGLVTAQSNGTVWAKAVSASNATQADSLEITITGQAPNGISETNGATAFNIYPNPAHQHVYFEYTFSKATTAFVRVSDLLGRVILDKALGTYDGGKQVFSLDIAAFQPGLYILEFAAADYRSVNKLEIK